MSYTKGPWKLDSDGWISDSTGCEVMAYAGCGSHEAYIEKAEDGKLLIAAPELYEAAKRAQEIIKMFIPNVSKCFNIDFQLLNEGSIALNKLLERLKEIE